MLYFLLIIIIIIVIHIRHNKITNDNYTILQLDNAPKNIIEDTFNKKLPTVITNVGSEWTEFMSLTPEYIKKSCSSYPIKIHTTIKEQQKTKIVNTTMGSYIEWLLSSNKENSKRLNQYISNNNKFLIDYGLDKKLDNYINSYYPPLSLIKNYLFSMGPKGSKVGLQYENNFRNIIYQVYGTIKIILFNPSYTKYLYKSNRYDSTATLSKVNFWKPDLEKYPLFKKAQFIEVILRQGQMLYIPAYWWYAVENVTTAITISIKFENVFSSIQKIPRIIKSLYHLNGKYKKNNCTCHNSI